MSGRAGVADQAFPSPGSDRFGVSGRARTPAIPPADTAPLDATAHPRKETLDTSTPPRALRRAGREHSFAWIVPSLYILFLLVPIYWLVVMSFKTNTEIVTGLTLWPQNPTLQHYRKIFTDPSWYTGYLNSIIYVVLNTIISISVALPAAYAFSRYRFLGDKHLFFWLLTNRMAPPAVFALPFFQLYSAVGLFDTHIAVALAHCLFNVPLAVWILEGFMSGVPKEIDETAYIDGYSFPRFFVKIFMPLIASGVGVAAFFCFMFSWVELLLARTLTTVNAKPIAATMTRTVSASGLDWGLLAAAGVLTIVPGALVIYFVRNYIAKGFALGRV
jgi:glycerol transport system permease protein